MIESAFPILSTPDLARALGFYEDLSVARSPTASPTTGRPNTSGWTSARRTWASVQIRTSMLRLGTERFSLWVYVDDCDAVVETSRAAGVTVLEEPVDQPWGERVARIADPDGNVVIIGARGEMAPDG